MATFGGITTNSPALWRRFWNAPAPTSIVALTEWRTSTLTTRSGEGASDQSPAPCSASIMTAPVRPARPGLADGVPISVTVERRMAVVGLSEHRLAHDSRSPPVGARARAERASERGGHVLGGGEAAGAGDLGQAEARGLQHLPRALDAPAHEPAVRRQARGGLEGAREVAGREARRGGEVVEREVLVQPVLRERCDAAEPPRVERPPAPGSARARARGARSACSIVRTALSAKSAPPRPVRRGLVPEPSRRARTRSGSVKLVSCTRPKSGRGPGPPPPRASRRRDALRRSGTERSWGSSIWMLGPTCAGRSHMEPRRSMTRRRPRPTSTQARNGRPDVEREHELVERRVRPVARGLEGAEEVDRAGAAAEARLQQAAAVGPLAVPLRHRQADRLHAPPPALPRSAIGEAPRASHRRRSVRRSRGSLNPEASEPGQKSAREQQDETRRGKRVNARGSRGCAWLPTDEDANTGSPS